MRNQRLQGRVIQFSLNLELPISCIDSMLEGLANPIEHPERREEQSEHEEEKYRSKLDNVLKDGITHSRLYGGLYWRKLEGVHGP